MAYYDIDGSREHEVEQGRFQDLDKFTRKKWRRDLIHLLGEQPMGRTHPWKQDSKGRVPKGSLIGFSELQCVPCGFVESLLWSSRWIHSGKIHFNNYTTSRLQWRKFLLSAMLFSRQSLLNIWIINLPQVATLSIHHVMPISISQKSRSTVNDAQFLAPLNTSHMNSWK